MTDRTTNWAFDNVPGESVMIANNREDPARIEYTDYWKSERARLGVILCSVYANAFRVLVPLSASGPSGGEQHMLEEMDTGKTYMVLKGPNQNGQPSYRFVFDDGTFTPYFFEISTYQTLIAQQLAEGECRLIVYIDGHRVFDHPATYRTVKRMEY
jgi:hypothetical protein